jgi:hypothetical protein
MAMSGLLVIILAVCGFGLLIAVAAVAVYFILQERKK